MFEIYESSAFKKDRKRESKNPRYKDLDQRIVEVLLMIYKNGSLPPKFKLHKLKGRYSEYLECHVKPDLLMIFRLEKNSVFLYRLGSHAELFR
jgi:mRNA interferase YafQ